MHNHIYYLILGTSVPGGAPGSSSTGSAIQGKKGYPVSVFVCSDPSAYSAATAAIKRFVKNNFLIRFKMYYRKRICLYLLYTIIYILFQVTNFTSSIGSNIHRSTFTTRSGWKWSSIRYKIIQKFVKK